MKARRHKLLILLLVQLAFFGVLWLAAGAVVRALYPLHDVLSHRLVLPLAVLLLSYFFLAWKSIYSRDYHYYLRSAHSAVLKNAFLPSALACLAFLLLGAVRAYPLPLLLVFFAAGLLSFPVVEGCQHLWVRHLSRLGYFRKKVLVVGRPGPRRPGDSWAHDFGSTKTFAGEIDRSDGRWLWKPAADGAGTVVEGIAQIKTIILKENIGDVLLFSGGSEDPGFERELMDYCHLLPISYYRVPPETGTEKNRIASLLFPNVPVSERFAGPRDSLTAVSMKRLLDVAISLACLVLFLPAGLLIALAILAESGGPVFYVATRIGKNGRPIRFIKFRTMVRDADKQKERLLAFNARADGPLFKMKNDPRVTRVGRLLRRHSLDEVPQFLNVLQGTMSLVGPRPHLPQEVAAYRDGDYLRLECMPGIVGLPQASGRGATMGFREWVDLDLSYRQDWSLTLDLTIIVRTLRVLLRGTFARHSSDHY